jgi:hypothetical protein
MLTKTMQAASKRLEALSMATAFAEAGDPDTARKILEDAKKPYKPE